MASITPAQAIRNAIEAELAAERFYRLLADSTEDESSREFLLVMAEQEQLHAASIEEASKQMDLALPDHAVGMVEVVETVPEWRFVDGITMADAVQVALNAEQQAALYYDSFADHFEGEIRAFFQQLAEAEEDHAHQLIKLLPKPDKAAKKRRKRRRRPGR